MIFVVIALIVGLVFFLAFKLTIGSIESLGYKFSAFYPFNKFVPKGNLWSAIFYLTLTTAITLFVILLAKGNIGVTPA